MAGNAFWDDHEADLKDPVYRRDYLLGTHRIATIDAVINGLDEEREKLELSKTALARRVGMSPPAIRRLLTAKGGNPTLATIATVAASLGYRLTLERMPQADVTEIDRTLTEASPDAPISRRRGRRLR